MSLDRARLIKLLAMTTSSNDGEALAAIRRANSALKAAGTSWEALLQVAVRPSTTPRTPPPRSSHKEPLERLFEEAMRNARGTFHRFISDLYDQWQKSGHLTPAQWDAVRKAARDDSPYDWDGHGDGRR